MRIERWARFLLAATPLLGGCGNFWQAPNATTTTGFSLSASPASVTLTAGATTGNNSTITVTPGSSFTGTVTLTCAVTSSPSGATSPATCALSPTSLNFSNTTAQPSTLTAKTTSTTTLGAYDITVTGVSSSITETTSFCVEVGTGTCTAAATSSGTFYILNGGTEGSVSGYSISDKTLNKVGNQILITNLTPYAIAIAPNDQFLCVSTSGGVYAYPITSGALGTGVKVDGDSPYSIQIDATNKWLIEAVPFASGSGGVQLNAVPISPTTGASVQGNVGTAQFTISGATLPRGQMVVSGGDNSNVIVALGEGGAIVVPFRSGTPFPAGITALHIPVATSGGSALSVGVDPGSSPRLFYVGETLASSASGGLRSFNYSSLPSESEIAGSPIASGGLAPKLILPVTTPDYVYVADGAGSITGFAIAGSAVPYTVTKGSDVTAIDTPTGMAVDSTGSWVFEVGSTSSPYFDAFTFDASTAGQLDSQVTSTAPATSIAIVAAPK